MSWIPTYTGRIIDFQNPDPTQVNVIDIAQGLSSQVRWTGQIDAHYSIAEHSVWVSRMVPDEIAFFGLLHDAAEAYVSDVVKPLKKLLPGFEDIEARVLAAIWRAFGVQAPSREVEEQVKEVDLRMLATEREQLVFPVSRHWEDLVGVEPYPVRLQCLERVEACNLFLQRFDQTYRLAKVA